MATEFTANPTALEGNKILDNRDYRGLSGTGSGHGQYSFPGTRAGDRLSRR